MDINKLISELWQNRNEPTLAEPIIQQLQNNFGREAEYRNNVLCYDIYRRDLSIGLPQMVAYKTAMKVRRDLEERDRRKSR
jgi:hypothetical protein